MDLGAPELLVILAIAILIFGGSRITELGASLGKGIKEFKKEINSADAPPTPSIAEALGIKTTGAATDSVVTPMAATTAFDVSQRICPTCGAANVLTARFCSECGTAYASTPVTVDTATEP